MSDTELDSYRNKLNNTRNLLEDSFSNGPYTGSMNSNNYNKINNTAYLLGEKTSMLDGKISKINHSKHFSESQMSIKSLSNVLKNNSIRQETKKDDSDIENGNFIII